MKRYTKHKKKKINFRPEIIYELLVEEGIKDFTMKPMARSLSSVRFDSRRMTWIISESREIITFCIDGINYDALMPECQVVRMGEGFSYLHTQRASVLTKIIFGKFKKTPEYYAIPKELRIENLKN